MRQGEREGEVRTSGGNGIKSQHIRIPALHTRLRHQARRPERPGRRTLRKQDNYTAKNKQVADAYKNP